MMESAQPQQAAKAVLNRYFAGDDAEALATILAGYPDLPACGVEALALYSYNQQCMDQEIIHPGGEIECRDPLHPDFLESDTSRLLYQAVAWYQQMDAQLQRIDGEWESWTEGVFSYLQRDEEDTTYWMVRDLVGGEASRWTLQIEREGVLQ